ncbi:hypothetical protein IMCC3088_1815 [Aequoribacter fuscus]|uniref:Uncharacterized protein n=1 Tax=Aequoribacter fuscus TaxID=2518989 RepID=F3L2P1_9GAMM|nr:hypothetical protein IMCC3088_1815 [Aequoribacter fuscus]
MAALLAACWAVLSNGEPWLRAADLTIEFLGKVSLDYLGFSILNFRYFFCRCLG